MCATTNTLLPFNCSIISSIKKKIHDSGSDDKLNELKDINEETGSTAVVTAITNTTAITTTKSNAFYYYYHHQCYY